MTSASHRSTAAEAHRLLVNRPRRGALGVYLRAPSFECVTHGSADEAGDPRTTTAGGSVISSTSAVFCRLHEQAAQTIANDLL